MICKINFYCSIKVVSLQNCKLYCKRQIILSNEYGRNSSSKYGESEKLFGFGATFFIFYCYDLRSKMPRSIYFSPTLSRKSALLF